MTNTKPARSVAQIRSEIKAYKEKLQSEREASKKNPHIEELRHLVAQVEQGRVNGIADRLKNIIASMEESPLVLKVRPRVLEYVNSDDYRVNLVQPCGMLSLRDAVSRANQVVQAVNILLFLL